MKKINLLLTFAFLFFGFASFAQVKFKLSYDFDTEKYTVSVVPQATYNEPQNITGTGQVTIKVPTNEFDVVEIENHLEGMPWEANSRNNSPTEAPEFDYISFALVMQGTAFPIYEEGVELVLFSFQNAFGCAGKIYLVDNQEDPFMPPNSQNANIGNTLTILGAGGDAYGGLITGGECDCNPSSVSSTAEELGFNAFRVYPNPVVDVATVEITWDGENTDAYLQMVDATGKLVHVEPVNIGNGTNRTELAVGNYAAGSYFLYLAGEDWEKSLDKINVVK